MKDKVLKVLKIIGRALIKIVKVFTPKNNDKEKK